METKINMTAPIEQNQAQLTTQAQVSDKELNFRRLEQSYQQKLEQERAARLELERQLQEKSKPTHVNDDEEDDEPYVDKKKLTKTLQRFGEQTQKQTQSEIQTAVAMALKEERRQNWLKQNSDFYDVMQHAEKFAETDPELAETILEMPDTFERQKLVYKNIKALRLHQPKAQEPSIQQKIDANRRSPYYQPNGVGAAPYASAGDFSTSGQKNAYEKMLALKNNLRL
jgi:hypothetical protein